MSKPQKIVLTVVVLGAFAILSAVLQENGVTYGHLGAVALLPFFRFIKNA